MQGVPARVRAGAKAVHAPSHPVQWDFQLILMHNVDVTQQKHRAQWEFSLS